MASIWAELKRRNVISVSLLYAVMGWVLLQIADILFGLLDVPGWGLRLVLGLLLLGLPLVVIFSWVFEMTPEGLKREKEIDRTHSVTSDTGRKIDRLIIFGLVAIVVVLLADRVLFMSDSEDDTRLAEQSPVATVTGAADNTVADHQQKSIAVLPFVNMSGDEENEYFSDGLTEELLNLLAKVDGLRVSSRTSSFAFKGKDSSLPSVARELNVRHVDTVSVKSYDHQNQANAEVLKAPDPSIGDGTGVLVIDDLVDTGGTLEVVQKLYPKAHFATVYAKPKGKPLVQTFITEVSQDTWIFFPWDMALQYVEPYRGTD